MSDKLRAVVVAVSTGLILGSIVIVAWLVSLGLAGLGAG